MLNKHVPFFERTFIKQQLEPLARRQLTFGMLRVDSLLPATQAGFGPLLFEQFLNVIHGFYSIGFLRIIVSSSSCRAATDAASRPAKTASSAAGSAA